MRPLWTGAISFGLVNIPVGLYSATSSSSTIDLDLLRDSDHSRIRYKKVAEADGQEVPQEHIVKGYAIEKEKYVVLTKEDFKRVQIPSNQTVDIKEFVQRDEIDDRYFDKPYFLAPLKGGQKAYALLREALVATGLAAIAKVVIRPPREHLAVVQPLGDLLVLETLHFAHELRDPGELEVPKTSLGKKELDMAVSLVNTMADKWDPEKYHDEYRDGLLDLIEKKAKSGGKELPAPQKTAESGDVIDLVSLLQESLGKADKREKSAKPASRAKRHHRQPQKKAA
jgi:DNA end-binding protein Ku